LALHKKPMANTAFWYVIFLLEIIFALSYHMYIGVFVINAVSALLLPPLNLILVCATGLALRRRYRRLGTMMSVVALILMTIFSTRAGALLLIAPLENRIAPLVAPAAADAQAIVVLGGGRLADAPEYDGKDVPNEITLARLRYAARLHRATGLPLLVTGGTPDGSPESEASTMARALQQDFAVPVRWLEEDSRNTAENAKYSTGILKPAGVRRILLVTDGIHMPRSRLIFEQAGLEVIPAPTILLSRDRLSAFHFLPSGEGMRRSHYAAHEWVGGAWYRLRHRHPT
jgi:uncharacterized SAM-binding protein YcdF (DUF218 family)